MFKYISIFVLLMLAQLGAAKWVPCNANSKACCNPHTSPVQVCPGAGHVKCQECGGGSACECSNGPSPSPPNPPSPPSPPSPKPVTPAPTPGTPGHPFVPMCMAEQCSAEAMALGGDAYVSALGKCTVDNFGPCATKAWDCLGDTNCRAVLTCAPHVLNECKADVWKMLTDPDEREKLMCLTNCMKDGSVNPFCVATKCGAAAAECLVDSTCLETLMCIPKAQLACSKPAFECIFGSSSTCRDNLKCLANGAVACGSPAVNMLTDAKIADFVSCAGSKCPHPMEDASEIVSNTPTFNASLSEPGSTATQLLCMAEHCSSKSVKILMDQDMKDLLTCAMQDDVSTLCSSVWDCLGETACANELTCLSKPLETCGQNIWELLTNKVERQRIEETATCLRNCEHSNADDFVKAAFCVMDTCSQKVLDCYKDQQCREAVKCLPQAVGQCAMPSLDAYNHDKLFKSSVQCFGRGLEVCGRAAVELLRNTDIADAVRCAAQCTRTPKEVEPRASSRVELIV